MTGDNGGMTTGEAAAAASSGRRTGDTMPHPAPGSPHPGPVGVPMPGCRAPVCVGRVGAARAASGTVAAPSVPPAGSRRVPVRPRRHLIFAVVSATVLVACGGDGATGVTGDGATPATAGDGILPALCEATAAADAAEAERGFALAHGGLHELASDLQADGDRQLAGDVLEAKQQVEALLDRDAPTDELSPALEQLTEATRRGLVSLGGDATACPG
jgi:hypothetical protein